MRIVYVCADPGIPVLGGKGASVHVRSVARALVDGGHEVAVAARCVGAGNPAPPGRPITELHADPEIQADQLGRLIAETGAQDVIERYSLGCGPARRAAEVARLPLVLEVNAPIVLEAARHRGLADVDRWLAYERSVFGSADAIGVVSNALARYVLGIAPSQIVRWIANGVDPAAFDGCPAAALGLPPGSVTVGFAGSMKRWHGVTDLIEAFSRPAVPPSTHLVLIGTGPEATAVEKMVDASGLSDRVVALGEVEHHRIPSLFAALDIGVAPYTPQADFYFSPLKVLEYLAAGLPVVCPALGDLPEVVDGAGILYPPGDVDALAGSIATLAGDQSVRRAMAERARHRVQRWTWSANAAAYVRLAEAAGAQTGHVPGTAAALRSVSDSITDGSDR